MESEHFQSWLPFQLQHDRPFPFQIKLAVWNPDKDLLAMVTDDSKVLLHRLNWQRLWMVSHDDSVRDTLEHFLVKHGEPCGGKEVQGLAGFTQSKNATIIFGANGLPFEPDKFIIKIQPLFFDWLCNIMALSGACRLIKHLCCSHVPNALILNSTQKGCKEFIVVIVGGDEVRNQKSFPEVFLDAADLLKIKPSSCLVIEDSSLRVVGAKATKMHVVVVPFVPKQTHLYLKADEVINSLLDFKPEKWSFPPFDDWIDGTLPIKHFYIGGVVIKGFKRGSKLLGIPTANLSTQGYSHLLSQHPSGVYFGWAGLLGRGIYKMVMSIGWNPYFNNPEKTIEPWLCHEFDGDFYGSVLHLVVVGYIRPEVNFSTLEGLVQRIWEDRGIAERALDLPAYSPFQHDPYLK